MAKAKKHQRAPVEQIEVRPLASLIPYARNPRLHSPEQVEQIAASLREFKQTQPVVVDEAGEIIAGHGRVLAAEKLGWKDIVVAVAVGWSDQQKRAYRVADNKIALNSSWDSALLRGELVELKVDGYELSLTGFDPDSLVTFLAEPSGPDEFRTLDEASVPTEHKCPKCGYRWSGGG